MLGRGCPDWTRHSTGNDGTMVEVKVDDLSADPGSTNAGYVSGRATPVALE